jgi:hypothetical protein
MGRELHVHGNCYSEDETMSPREAIRILMLSPIYFRMSTLQRWQLVREYCQRFNSCKT